MYCRKNINILPFSGFIEKNHNLEEKPLPNYYTPPSEDEVHKSLGTPSKGIHFDGLSILSQVAVNTEKRRRNSEDEYLPSEHSVS